MPIITLTTDFGLNDWFVGAMKGVILDRSPKATVVDITHGVPAGDVRAGAFALLASYRFFRRGTVHLVVVDPGVGSGRAAVAVRTERYRFIGPDNGALSLALRHEHVLEIRRLENQRLFLDPVSATFHGRDVFAPIAAYLAGGGAMSAVGKPAGPLLQLDWPLPRPIKRGWRGEVMYVDRFGNAITNLSPDELGPDAECRWQVALTGRQPCRLRECYQTAAKGEPLGIIGSCGLLEIAVNSGHAARELRLKVGSRISVYRAGGGAR